MSCYAPSSHSMGHGGPSVAQRHLVRLTESDTWQAPLADSANQLGMDARASKARW